mgnify:CR=1 FL=1
MLARARPGDAYRESNFDARLVTSGREDLILICFDDLIENLGVLEIAETRNDRAVRSRALTRCGCCGKASADGRGAYVFGSARKGPGRLRLRDPERAPGGGEGSAGACRGRGRRICTTGTRACRSRRRRCRGGPARG